MQNQYDVIVIGGGHNGLTAATTLAMKDKKVLLLEKNSNLGGIARGHEFLSGYHSNGLLHDTSAVRTSIIRKLELEKFGLKATNKKPGITILSLEGQSIHLSNEIEEAAKAISQFSKKDAEAYKEYRKFIEKISHFISPLLNEIPPNLVHFGAKELLALGRKGLALKKLGKQTMMELLKVAPMSVADFLNERFETNFLKAGLAAPAIYGSYTGPWSSYTTLNLLIWECCANENIIGGPQSLINSLEKAAMSSGVEIRKATEVKRITLDSSGVVDGVLLANGTEEKSKIVAATCTPQATFMDLFHPNQIEHTLENEIIHYRSRGTTAKVNLAMNEEVKFINLRDMPFEFARTGNSFDEMEQAFDYVKYRQFSKDPILDIYIPTVHNPELAPKGHSVVSILVNFAPYNLEGGWNDEQKEKLGDRVIATFIKYIENSRASIIGKEVLSPIDLEKNYGLTEGHIFHGEHAIDQLITRPIPYCARYDTPMPGLYLCGSGSHPGGGITCAPGALGAERILKNS